MARRALGPGGLHITAAIAPWLQGAQGRVAVACSGGADSMALLAGSAWVVERRKLDQVSLSVLTVDHGLQPGSREVANQVAAVADQLGLPTHVVSVDVVPDDPAGPEAAARAARMAAFEASDADLVLLGHTLDDQAETVLLGLARGSGARSLAGMPTRRGRLVRPLIAVPRAVTEQACQEWGLPVWQDPHNRDPRFLRSRVRTEVMPVLREVLGPGTVAALARSADLLRADADLLDQWAHDHQIVGPVAEVNDLAGVAMPLATRMLRSWLIAQGARSPSADQVAAVWDLVTDWHGQGPVALAGLEVYRQRGRLMTSARRRH